MKAFKIEDGDKVFEITPFETQSANEKISAVMTNEVGQVLAVLEKHPDKGWGLQLGKASSPGAITDHQDLVVQMAIIKLNGRTAALAK